MLYGAVAEILAIYALYQQQAKSATAQNVFLAVTFMVIMAAAPALAFYRAMIVPLAHGSNGSSPARAALKRNQRPPKHKKPTLNTAGAPAAGLARYWREKNRPPCRKPLGQSVRDQ